jgi:hypothetical protein
MPSSGVLRHVAVVGTDISEECSGSIIRVTRISELGTVLAVTCYRFMLRRNTIIPEDGILHSHCHENLKSYTMRTVVSKVLELFHLVMADCLRKLHYTYLLFSLIPV